MKRFSLTIVALGAFAPPLQAQEEGGGGLLTVDGGLMVWTLLVFGLLFVILRRAAWPKLLAAVEARERSIEQQLEEARRSQEEAEKLLEQQRQLLEQARAEAGDLIAKAKGAAEHERQTLLRQARGEQEEILERARREIEAEKDRAVEELRREAVDISLAAASRVLEQSVDSEQNRRLVEEYLRSLSETQ